MSICPYCAPGKIRYQLTAEKKYEQEFNKTDQEFKEFMGKLIVSEHDEEIETIVYRELKEHGYHISCAESCTGGLLASTIINVSGASDIINESYVTYSNEAKIKVLKVKKESIEKYDVVSEEVVKEMANGLLDLINDNYTTAE